MSVLDDRYYEVRRWMTGAVVYSGESLTQAATALVAGTCFGKGPTPEAASRDAQQKASLIRRGVKQ